MPSSSSIGNHQQLKTLVGVSEFELVTATPTASCCPGSTTGTTTTAQYCTSPPMSPRLLPIGSPRHNVSDVMSLSVSAQHDRFEALLPTAIASLFSTLVNSVVNGPPPAKDLLLMDSSMTTNVKVIQCPLLNELKLRERLTAETPSASGTAAGGLQKDRGGGGPSVDDSTEVCDTNAQTANNTQTVKSGSSSQQSLTLKKPSTNNRFSINVECETTSEDETTNNNVAALPNNSNNKTSSNNTSQYSTSLSSRKRKSGSKTRKQQQQQSPVSDTHIDWLTTTSPTTTSNNNNNNSEYPILGGVSSTTDGATCSGGRTNKHPSSSNSNNNNLNSPSQRKKSTSSSSVAKTASTGKPSSSSSSSKTTTTQGGGQQLPSTAQETANPPPGGGGGGFSPPAPSLSTESTSQTVKSTYVQKLVTDAINKVSLPNNSHTAQDFMQHIEEVLMPQGSACIEVEKKKVKTELRRFDLAFEKKFGYAPTKEDKEPMRRVYIYYRCIKTALDQAVTPSGVATTDPPGRSKTPSATKAEPMPIVKPTFQFTAAPTQPTPSIESPAAAVEAEPVPLQQELWSAGTQNAGVQQAKTQFRVNSKNSDTASVSSRSTIGSSITVAELEARLRNSMKQKSILSKKLQEYQSEFLKTRGRAIKYHRDIVPVESDYKKYKKLRAQVHILQETIKTRNTVSQILLTPFESTQRSPPPVGDHEPPAVPQNCNT